MAWKVRYVKDRDYANASVWIVKNKDQMISLMMNICVTNDDELEIEPPLKLYKSGSPQRINDEKKIEKMTKKFGWPDTGGYDYAG